MLTELALFLLVIVALLAIPVTLRFQLSRYEHLQGEITLKWAFVSMHIPVPSAEKITASPEQKQPKAHHRQHNSSRHSNPLALIREYSFRRRLLRFISELWQAIHKQDLLLRLRLGLGDPADTGQLWAIIGPLTGVFSNSKAVRLEIEPEFMDEVFELESHGVIRLIPLQILYLLSTLLLSPSIWHGMRKMRRAA